MLHGYSNITYPNNQQGVTESNILNVTYYDDYDWISPQSVIYGYGFSSADDISQTGRTSHRVTGLITGTLTKVLEKGALFDQWLTSSFYYDNNYNAIQAVVDLYPSGSEIVSNQHNSMGQVIRTKVKQTVNNTAHEYNKWFDYDEWGRLLRIRQRITDDPQGEVLLAEYGYDELGNVIFKKIHGNKEETKYVYDIFRRIISAESPSFFYTLYFDKLYLTPGRVDGLVSSVKWGHDSTKIMKAYVYTYNMLGQLTDAQTRESNPPPYIYQWNLPTNKFRESATYDKNGNILTMQRYGSNLNLMTHDYTYTYNHPTNGYALTNVSSSPNDYLYNAIGDMTYDGMNDIQIEYNEINLPQRMSTSSGQALFVYTANGEKIAATNGNNVNYYRNTMVYSGATGEIEYILHPEGFAIKEDSVWVYKYFKTDHLGNTRALLAVRNNVLINEQQNTDYYPFGLAHQLDSLHLNKYLFGGKQYQDAPVNGSPLGLYDFHARYYNPLLGRWSIRQGSLLIRIVM